MLKIVTIIFLGAIGVLACVALLFVAESAVQAWRGPPGRFALHPDMTIDRAHAWCRRWWNWQDSTHGITPGLAEEERFILEQGHAWCLSHHSPYERGD